MESFQAQIAEIESSFAGLPMLFRLAIVLFAGWVVWMFFGSRIREWWNGVVMKPSEPAKVVELVATPMARVGVGAEALHAALVANGIPLEKADAFVKENWETIRAAKEAA